MIESKTGETGWEGAFSFFPLVSITAKTAKYFTGKFDAEIPVIYLLWM